MKQAASKVTDCVTKIATEHRCVAYSLVDCQGKDHDCQRNDRDYLLFRELHSSVSKVGKAVDRNFVADFDSTAREEVYLTF